MFQGMKFDNRGCSLRDPLLDSVHHRYLEHHKQMRRLAACGQARAALLQVQQLYGLKA
jgi:hypothetical protein